MWGERNGDSRLCCHASQSTAVQDESVQAFPSPCLALTDGLSLLELTHHLALVLLVVAVDERSRFGHNLCRRRRERKGRVGKGREMKVREDETT